MQTNIRTLLCLIAIIALVIAAYQAGFNAATIKLTPRLKSFSDQAVSKRVDIDLRVVAAGTGLPIPNARLEMTLAHAYGNGAYTTYLTDRNGSITTTQDLYPGHYQIDIYPPLGSEFQDRAYFADPDTMLKIESDGTYSPKEFAVQNK
jgi:hypothetical protein